MHARVVVHYLDGALLKGVTHDINPNRDSFHVKDHLSGEVAFVEFRDLKAVFFVKSYEGDPAYEERRDLAQNGFGPRIRISFRDGEIMEAYTLGYDRNRPYFYIFPPDPDSNNDKVLVVRSAARQIEVLRTG
jgi:hypothetical protein